MIRFYLVRPYSRHVEGTIPNSIVTYGKLPFASYTVDTDDWWGEQIIQYKHVLLVDLWFCKLKFSWLDRKRNATPKVQKEG